MAKSEFERVIEQATGKTVEKLREMPIDEYRRKIEKKHGKPMTVTESGAMVLTHKQALEVLARAIK